MKRLFLITALIICLSVGIAYAAQIQRVVDPKNQTEVWITSVFNNSAKELTVGEVVVWDIGSSTGDDDNYVTVTTSADTNLVAGVVYPANIPIDGVGSIVIHGAVDVDLADSGCTVDDVLCTSTTTDKAKDCTSDAYGFATCMEATAATGLSKCMVKIQN